MMLEKVMVMEEVVVIDEGGGGNYPVISCFSMVDLFSLV